MSRRDDELLPELRRQFLAKAMDYPQMEVVSYVGRWEAFPDEIKLNQACDSAWWPLASPSGRPPSFRFVESLDDRTELLAFFGDNASLSEFVELSRVTLNAVRPQHASIPDDRATDAYPAVVWTRWLFDAMSSKTERNSVYWHTASAGANAISEPLTILHRFDPMVDKIDYRRQKEGYREWGCVAARFSASLFEVSAEALAAITE